MGALAEGNHEGCPNNPIVPPTSQGQVGVSAPILALPERRREDHTVSWFDGCQPLAVEARHHRRSDHRDRSCFIPRWSEARLARDEESCTL